jgi:hypothetical protein
VGFVKDIRKLQKQAKEASQGWDPGAQMRQTREAMEAAGAMMEQQAAAATLAATGDPATAQVNAARDTGQMINLQPVVELSLLVFRAGQPPYPVTLRQIVPVSHMGRLLPGTRLAVKVDPQAPETVWIDWTGS